MIALCRLLVVVAPAVLGPIAYAGAASEISGGSQFNYDNEMRNYFFNVTKGPGVIKWDHYFDIYHKHLKRFRRTDVHVMEIGVFSGGGLRMWRWYFGSRARLYGLDVVNHTRSYERHPNYGRPKRVFIGDQADPQSWKRILRQLPRLDVVLDDGGHTPEQQEVTLRMVFPHLSPGGVYLCEDVHGTNFYTRNVFMDYVHLSSGLNAFDNYEAIDKNGSLGVVNNLSPAQRDVAEVSFYPFVVVLEKRPFERPLRAFLRGSQWMPMVLLDGREIHFPGIPEIPNGTIR